MESTTNIVAARPKKENGKIATTAPANTKPHLFLCKANIPPIKANAAQANRGTIIIGTRATVSIGKEDAGMITKILATRILSKINSLKPASTIRRIPVIMGIDVRFLSISFSLYCSFFPVLTNPYKSTKLKFQFLFREVMPIGILVSLNLEVNTESLYSI